MGSLLVLAILYAIVHLLILGVAVAVGFLLNWIIPSVDLGMAILIGLASTIASFHFFSRLANATQRVGEEDDDENVMLVPVPAFRRRRESKRKKQR